MRNLFRCTGVIVLVTALSGAALSGCTPAPPKLFGMHSDHTWDVDNTRISSALDAEAAFGSDISRNTLRWDEANPELGEYDWSQTDFVVDEAVDRGMKVELVVRAAPYWANASNDSRVIPSDPGGLSSFVTLYKGFFKKAVQRYGDRVKYWEVWTEPNQNHFFQPRNLTPQGNTAQWIDIYTQLYRDTLAAVRSVNTSVQVAIGAITGLGGPNTPASINGAYYLDQLIQRDLAFDHLAINPHSLRNQAPWTTIAYENNFSDIQKMRDVLVYNNRSSVTMWVTEFGWQVAGYTTTGTTKTKLRVPGNIYRLALWPNSGQVNVNGVVKNYSSITRTSTYNDINLTSALASVPANNTPVNSSQAEATQATYVQEAIKMLRGTYVPQSGRPQQNYSYIQISIYFQNYDRETVNWGMYGLMHEPVPDYNHPGKWFLQGRASALAFMEETD